MVEEMVWSKQLSRCTGNGGSDSDGDDDDDVFCRLFTLSLCYYDDEILLYVQVM